MRIAPYILAGGRSSRMGRDKAMLPLAGKTLLQRAVEILQAIPSLQNSSTEGVKITLIGERTELEGADRMIVDRYPLCGPLGGIEAALHDLNHLTEKDDRSEWVFFIPVDMPFLPAAFLHALLLQWLEVIKQAEVLACHLVVDDRPQPLISLIHRSLQPFVLQALERGDLKVTPVLQACCDAVTPQKTVHRTNINGDGPIDFLQPGTTLNQTSRHLWFANINQEADLAVAETFLGGAGLTNG